MQGGYWGFGGAVDHVKSSLARVLERKPDLDIPSHGAFLTTCVARMKALPYASQSRFSSSTRAIRS